MIYFRLLFYNLRDSWALSSKRKDLSDDERYLSAMGIAFLASMAGYFSAGSFISVLYYPHYWYVTAIIVAATRLKARMNESAEVGRPLTSA